MIGVIQHRVMELIQDNNGTHVIQTCLNRLTFVDARVKWTEFDFLLHRLIPFFSSSSSISFLRTAWPWALIVMDAACCSAAQIMPRARSRLKSWIR